MVVPSATEPQRQPAIVLPPSVIPTKALLPVWMGASVKAFVVPVIVVKFASSAKTVIIPLLLTVTLFTYLVAVNSSQALGKMLDTSAAEEDCTAATIDVRQAEAANITSDDLALTV